jgi:hypothetical protein
MKSLTNLLLLVITILFSGCAAVDDGSMLNDYRGDLMSLNEVSGMRFYDVYFDYLFISPSNAPKAKAHFQKHGFPDYIYCDGQLGNYMIYSNDQLKIFHFEQSLNGLLAIKPVAFAELPYTAQNQLEHESYRKSFQKQLTERQGLEDEMLQSQQESLEKQQIEVQKLKDERQGLEERWRNEYLQERATQ